MKIFVDNELIEQENADGTETVEEALQQVQAGFDKIGRVVVSVSCDGKQIAANEMGKTLVQPLNSFERVDVVTGTKEGLVIEAMTQASSCIGDTEDTCKRVAELLKQGDTVEATQTLGKCLLVWQQIHEAVGKSIEMLNLDPDAITAGGETLIDIIGKPKTALLEMRDALQAQDYVLLADILEFEISEAIDSWRTIITELHREAEQRKQAENH